jgi:uncharacterized protein (DUF305 family)
MSSDNPIPWTTTHIGIRWFVFLTLLLGTFAALRVPVAAQQGPLDPAPNRRVAQIETDFMSGMILHHREAIMMAEMALDKAIHPELRDLAQEIIDAQRGEIETLTNYLETWYGMPPPTGQGMSPAMMSQMDMPLMQGMMPDMGARMMALESKSGADFEIEFLSAMTDHHATAIMMATPVLINGHHEDLYTLAEQVVIDQGEEIHQMDEWLDAWYGVARPLSWIPDWGTGACTAAGHPIARPDTSASQHKTPTTRWGLVS